MPKPRPQSWRTRSALSDDEVGFAATEQLRWIIHEHQHRGFVWPEEGWFNHGRWSFNRGHIGLLEPLLVDPTTASALLTVRDALNQSNQSIFEKELSAHRGSFGLLVDLTWNHRFRPKPGII
jgi:hypothetical protein